MPTHRLADVERLDRDDGVFHLQRLSRSWVSLGLISVNALNLCSGRRRLGMGPSREGTRRTGGAVQGFQAPVRTRKCSNSLAFPANDQGRRMRGLYLARRGGLTVGPTIAR